MKTITKNIAIFIITLGILSSPFSVHAATWVGPTATPPGNNVSAPVNVGGTYQIKAGDLGVISLFANYIKSLGTISANRYCFNNGTANGRDQNCITSWPAGGTGGGIQSIVAGTNVTVDNTDPLNPVISSTATGGPGGTSVAVQKDGTIVSASPSFLNFTGQQVSAVPDGAGVKIAISGTPVRLNNTQITASPTALNFTGLNMAATVTGGIVNIAVTPTAIQKDGIQVSAAPLAVNFVGDNITTTNTGGIVSVGVNKLTVQQNDTTIGSNFTGINFVGGNDWVVTNGGGGIARIENVANPVTQLALPSASPADRILRSDGTNWVQSPLVKHTVSSFQVNRPVADNSTDNIFQAAKMINVFGNPIPALGLFVTQQGDTYVNGAKFRNYYNGGTTATPTNSFGADDIFQVTTNASNTGSGLAVRGDAKVRVRGELSALNNAVVPLSTGLFLGANDIFHVVGELNGAKKGFGLAVDGTTRVEGILAVNGGEVIFGDRIHVGNTTQTGDTTQIGNYTMEGPGATMTLGNSTNSAQINITGNSDQLGNQYQAGDLNQLGDVSQTGDYSLIGNIGQTGNINTNGRWAVIDTAAPGPGVPQLPGVPPLYSFLASVGPGGNFGTLGIDRGGRTRIVGSLQVTGPITATGNLSVDGWVQSDLLSNSIGDAPVCADNFGRLKICAAATPFVDITSTGLANNSFTTPLLTYTPGQTSIPNPSVTSNVSYTISGASGGSSFSCQRTSSPSGNVSGWNTSSNFTVTTPAFTDTKNVTFNSYTPTQLNVVCENLDGQTASDLAVVTGRGSWTTGTGTSGNIGNFTFPAVQLTVEIVSGGGGGGGSLIDGGSINACGGGGGAGQYKTQNVPGGTYPLQVGAGGAGGQPNYLATFGAAGDEGGDTRFGNNVTLVADGGQGGLGGRKTQISGGGWVYQGGSVGSYHGVGGSSGTSGSICTFGTGKVPTTTFNSAGGGGRGGWSSLPNGFGLSGQPGSIRVNW